MANETILIRHRSYDAESKVIRNSRAGRRWQGFLLSDGTRLRRKGARGTEVGLDVVKENADAILEGIITGYLEILNPNPMPLQEVLEFLQGTLKATLDKSLLSEMEGYLHLHGITHTKTEKPVTKVKLQEVTPVVQETVVVAPIPVEEVQQPVEVPVEVPVEPPHVDESFVSSKPKKKGKKD
jgi:hypothetical protein